MKKCRLHSVTFSELKARKQAENWCKEWDQKLQREDATVGERMKERVTFCRSSLLRTRPHSLAPLLVCFLMAEGSSTQQCCSTRSHTEFRLQSVTTISVILTSFLSQPRTEKRGGRWPPEHQYNDSQGKIKRFPNSSQQKDKKHFTKKIKNKIKRFFSCAFTWRSQFSLLVLSALWGQSD